MAKLVFGNTKQNAVIAVVKEKQPVIDTLNVTPTTSAQTITAPSGTDGYSPVNVSAVDASIDANIVAGNIKSGVSILGVNGSVVELNGITTSVTPTTSAQTITPTAPNNGFTEVSVSAVTSAIDANIQAGNIKQGVTILGVAGNYSGITPTGTLPITTNGTYDVTNFASADVQVQGGVSGKYQLFDRIKDDNNVEIGTVSGFIKDANNNEFAVVCLDAKYRANNLATLSSTVEITGLTSIVSYLQWTNSQTATSNCNAIIDFISGTGYTSASISHCRTNSFTIDNVAYLGQLPVILELVDILKNRVEINNKDTSGSAYQSLLIPSAGGSSSLSCVQEGTNNMWVLGSSGSVQTYRKTFTGLAIPVLEIPNS